MDVSKYWSSMLKLQQGMELESYGTLILFLDSSTQQASIKYINWKSV